MENKPKNREWVKTAAIIFLLILLILTFFSNTILNRTLPQVSTYAVTDGSIAARVRATGKVSAIGNNQVKATGTRTIAAVKVKEGQEVNEGDVLFVMGSGTTEEIETATDARDSAYYAAKRANTNWPTAPTTADASLNAAYDALNRAQVAYDETYARYASQLPDSAEAQQLAQELEDAQNELTNAWAIARYEIEDAELAFSEAATNLAVRDAELQAAQAQYLIDHDEAAFNAALAVYDSAVTQYNQAKTIRDNLVTNGTVDCQLAQAAVNSAQSTYDAYMSSASTAYNAIQSAESNLASALYSYESAEASYYSSYSSYGQQSASVAVDVEEAQNTLAKKEERLANLTGEGVDVNVYATVSGIVETVNFSSGDTVTKDDVMCVIEVPDQGYTMTATVTKDQASRLKVGDEGTVSNYYWGSTITAKITAIKSDKTDPQGKREITFEIDGDVTNGQELTVSVGSKSATYDIVVPKSAVMSDNNGNYVLVITSKSSALGNRYFAKRVDVEVLAEDDSYKAISGDLGVGDFVITNSSTKINSGDQIRLADNA